MVDVGNLGMVQTFLPLGRFRSDLSFTIYTNLYLQYSPYLRNYAQTLGTVSFARVGPSGDPAVELFRKIWNDATGQEA